MPLRAVVFDYGMVLTGPANPVAHQRMLELTQLPKSAFEENYWRHRLDYDRGTLNGQTYWLEFARTAATTLDRSTIDHLIEQDILLWTDLNPVMLRWVTRVQAAGLRTGILSNMGEELLGHMRKNFFWLNTFDHCTWSCELNLIKPEAAIYRHTLDKLGVRAEEALFLDDKIENVEGAHRVGMNALVFRDATTLGADLVQAGWLEHLPALAI
ncbi:MAG TPA: HAD family phosphatase [Acidobacteriaceae bacterium]|jgi:putative hydrolase of the HAD superfamily|nr:HAD family phosphatase [Acidobacteriaceae bacterium]